MRKDLSTIGLAVFLSGVAALSTFGADPTTVTLHGHVPAVVSHGQTKPVGDVGGETVLNLSIGLPLRNRVALTHLIEQLSDPASPSYGKYLTSREFTDRFGPTEEDYQKVISFARKNGLTVIGTQGNRMLLNVSGKAADIEKAFSVSLHQYQHPTENRMFYAPDREPSVPGGLTILDISGLENYSRPHPHYRFKPQQSSSNPAQKAASKVQANATTGSGPFGNYVGNDFRNAYVPGTSLNGSGQTIALVQFDGYLASDIVAYENLVGRTNIPLQNVLIDGFSGVPTGSGGEVEVSLDIEMVISMAPALAQVILYEGSPFNFHPNDVLNQIAVDNSARQISCSWGWTGGPNGTTDQIFQEMLVQGQTFFDAVGDADAFLPGQVDDPTLPNEPSSNPYITQVGGTTLTMNGAGASYASETVWNWDIRFGPGDDGIGSSGGISSFYKIPSYQANVNMTLPQGSSTLRNVPDVALTADDVLVIADGGLEYTGVGGTSCASPLWAGFTALVNQQAAMNGHSAVGFLNPALYAIGTGPNYANCFHDIVTGANTWSLSPNLFSAVPGYDLCTGLGTPNGTNLINALVSSSISAPLHISPPPPPYRTNLSVLSGINPNGAWSLYMQDDTPINSGFVSNGWVLSLTLADIVGTAGDLQVLITPTNASTLVGQSVALSLSVTNYGPSTSTNVTVINNLPTGVVLVSSNATQGTVTKEGSTLVWNVGTLAVNAGAGLTTTIQPGSAGSLVDSAIVQAGTPDPNPDDDSATVTINSTLATVSLVPTLTGGGNSLQIGVPGPIGAGISVVIQANTNLAGTNWVNVYTGTPPFNFTDPAASSYKQRFYRAQIILP